MYMHMLIKLSLATGIFCAMPTHTFFVTPDTANNKE